MKHIDPIRTYMARDTQLFPCHVFTENKSPCLERRPERHCIFLDTSSQKTKAPARNADPREIAFARAGFPKKLTPLQGTPTRETLPFSGNVFPKNIRPCQERRHERHRIFVGMRFSQKIKAPARNADPRGTAFSGHVFLREQKRLLGTPTRGT